LSTGKSIEKLGYQEDSEITLLKHAFVHPSDNWCKPIDMFYLLELRKKVFRRWFCVILPRYTHTIETYPLPKKTYRHSKELLLGLIQGVYDLHCHGYYHGDLKPKNICVDNKNYVRLIDFGTAERLDNTNHQWCLKNTFGYFSPRQCFNHLTRNPCNYSFLTPEIQSKFGQEISDKIDRNKNIVSFCSYNHDPEKIFISISDHGITNDIFVLGLLIAEICSGGVHFLTKLDRSFNYEEESLVSIIENTIQFMSFPILYLQEYYKLTSFPSFAKPALEYCLFQWSKNVDSVTLNDTKTLLDIWTNIESK
jgi:serine/threonine protein kinase